MNNIPKFINAMMQSGITPPLNIIGDGDFHRISTNGKPNDKAGYYNYRPGVIATGCFGCWRSGIHQTWVANIGRKFTEEELVAHKKNIIAMQLQRDAETLKDQAEAKIKANDFWLKAAPVVDHPYLPNKGVKAYDIKQLGNTLIIPMSDAGEIHSLEFIQKNGSKSRLTDGRVKGCYHVIGEIKDVIRFAEGYATCASIYEAAGDATVVTFGKDNILKVAETFRSQYPSAELIICADDDLSGGGLKKANEAAKAVGASVVIPKFGENRPEGMKDFNDIHQLYGLDEVKAQLAVKYASASIINMANDALNVTDTNVITGRLQSAPEQLPSLPDVMPFDYAYLPDALRDYVMDISERLQCPPDFAAVGVTVMVAAIIGRQVAIRPMRKDSWTVIPNLWGAVIGNSGVMKSPTLSAALSPINRLAAAATRAFNELQSEYDGQAVIAKIQQSLGKDEAKKALAKDRTADVANLLKPTIFGEAPIQKRYKTNNATYEALGELMLENPNGILNEADEVIGVLKKLDASGQEEARAFFLTAADGDKGYTFDRISRGKGLHIEALCLSIIGGIQPGVLAEYVKQATTGGAGADGLLPRFSVMVYPDISPIWKEVDRYPDTEARNSVNALAERLDNLNANQIGAETDDFCNVPYLHFDDKAQLLFSEWRVPFEFKIRNGEEHPAIVSHLSKYRKLVPTLALINHLCDNADGGAVNESALLRAIAFCEYLETHARRIYSFATRPDIDSAKTILKKIEGGKLSNPFKVRDIYRACWTGLETPQKAQAAIDLLVEYNHLFLQEMVTGGRPTAFYHLNKVAAI